MFSTLALGMDLRLRPIIAVLYSNLYFQIGAHQHSRVVLFDLNLNSQFETSWKTTDLNEILVVYFYGKVII